MFEITDKEKLIEDVMSDMDWNKIHEVFVTHNFRYRSDPNPPSVYTLINQNKEKLSRIIDQFNNRQREDEFYYTTESGRFKASGISYRERVTNEVIFELNLEFIPFRSGTLKVFK